jgi:glyoxylase-like metal-dependent hydrolase (beta-lactamase superfamily II)
MFTFNPVQENTYVLWNEKGDAIIIDPGCYFTAEQETLQNFITEQNLNPVKIINTHCHFDHVFGLKWAAKTFNLEVYLHPIAEKELQFAVTSAMQWGFGIANYTGPFQYLNHGDIINFGNNELKVLFTPGHSPVAFVSIARNKILLLMAMFCFFKVLAAQISRQQSSAVIAEYKRANVCIAR